MKKIAGIFQILCFCLLASASGQSTGASGRGDTNQKQHAASAIFNEIMQTLPTDMKAQVDSASVAAKAPQENAASNARRPLKPAVQEPARDGAISKLPEEMRGKVEKAISDIDLMNQNRQIQFKEYEKRRQGGK